VPENSPFIKNTQSFQVHNSSPWSEE